MLMSKQRLMMAVKQDLAFHSEPALKTKSVLDYLQGDNKDGPATNCGPFKNSCKISLYSALLHFPQKLITDSGEHPGVLQCCPGQGRSTTLQLAKVSP